MENENLEKDELKEMLKKLSNVLIVEGLLEKNMERLVLGNTISMTLATIELGPEAIIRFMKVLNPHAEYLKEYIDAGKIKGASAQKTTFSISKDFPFEADIESMLKGTGVHIDPKEK